LLTLDHPWIQEYFNGPRGRAAHVAQQQTIRPDKVMDKPAKAGE
ncbi:MAG: ABC transporter ATP-binding protein, partial [Novosphingobium sp.]